MITNCDSTRLVPSRHWWNLGNACNGAWEGVFLLSFPWCNVKSLKPSHQSSRKQEKRLGTSLRQYKVLPSAHRSHLSQSWSHLVGQSSSNNHYISLTLKKAEKNRKYIRKQWIQFARFCLISQKLFKNRQSDFQCCGVNKLYVVFRGIMTRRVLVKETLFSSGYQTTRFNVSMTRTMKEEFET